MRVINKATNHYENWVEKEGIKTKELLKQKGQNWAIRKPMHKETVSGKVELSRIKVPKGKILTATRKSLDTSFDEKTIESITDTGIQKILKNYLASKENNSELAFSPEGIEYLNKNIRQYNDDKNHHPIFKVRIFEPGNKFSLGQSGNKIDKFVEAAKGTNLFFAIYIDEGGKRFYETIPLNIVIERQKQGLSAVPEANQNGRSLLFLLSPNDLVYVPTEEEKEKPSLVDFKNLKIAQVSRIYKFTDGSGTTLNFVPMSVASLLFNISYKDQEKAGINFQIQNEFGLGSPQSKNQNSLEGIQIKSSCWKLNVDRLGNIKPSAV